MDEIFIDLTSLIHLGEFLKIAMEESR